MLDAEPKNLESAAMLELVAMLFRHKTEAEKIGAAGESAAAKYLSQKRGMKILARNWRAGKDELDIVARDGECVVFVEVKTRSETAQVDGYYSAISKKKAAAVRNCSRAYLARMAQKPNNWRFDIIEVRRSREGRILSVSHHENIRL